MEASNLLPSLTELDPTDSSEGGIDPLGLYTIADALGVRLVPGVRERQQHPRFLTAIAVSHAVCSEFDADSLASDRVTPPWLVLEWYVVEGLVRAGDSTKTRGLPGSLKAAKAWKERVPLSAKRYLKSPTIFGFHGIYRLLARTLGVEDGGPFGFELLKDWAHEQGLDGFIGSGGGPGQRVRRLLVDAVQAGLKRGSTDRSPAWEGWTFFPKHLGIYDAGVNERRAIANALQSDQQGHRRELLEFLVSPSGRQRGDETIDERAFHTELRRTAGAELARLLEAISAYEEFARLCQDAFDDCLYEMTKHGSKTPASALARIPSVQRASQRVPELFSDVIEKLDPFSETARFRENFAGLAERAAAIDWMQRLADHHFQTQKRKPPDGKGRWFERCDDGSFILRPLYLRDEGGRNDESYVHGYRTNSLWSFAKDLKLVEI